MMGCRADADEHSRRRETLGVGGFLKHGFHCFGVVGCVFRMRSFTESCFELCNTSSRPNRGTEQLDGTNVQGDAVEKCAGFLFWGMQFQEVLEKHVQSMLPLVKSRVFSFYLMPSYQRVFVRSFPSLAEQDS
jgi:hypothetical protein